jgi:hypothetical protein
MRTLALILALPLAACASVEQRTDARSGPGLTNVNTGGGNVAGVERVAVTMQGYDAIPIVRVAGTPASATEAAQLALAAGGATWAPVVFGGTTYAMRQVMVGAYNFTVVEPQGTGPVATPDLLSTISVRTGCLTTGQTVVEGGRMAVLMNCS